MAASRVTVLGSVNTDLVVQLPRLPLGGETVTGGHFFQAAGGKGANQAVAAARLARSPVTFLAAVGNDALGEQALVRLGQENLDCRHVQTVAGVASGVALIMVDQAGQNQIGVALGANAHLRPEHVAQAPHECFPKGGVFLTVLESPLDTITQGITRAKAAGMTVILNPAPAQTEILTGALAPRIDILTPNSLEAAALAGISVQNEQEADDRAVEAARLLQQRGIRTLIITQGSRGALVVTDQVRQVPAAAVKAIDTTAAGDCFNGALAVALSEGSELLPAVKFAISAATLSVTRLGAQPSLPQRHELQAIASQQ